MVVGRKESSCLQKMKKLENENIREKAAVLRWGAERERKRGVRRSYFLLLRPALSLVVASSGRAVKKRMS